MLHQALLSDALDIAHGRQVQHMQFSKRGRRDAQLLDGKVRHLRFRSLRYRQPIALANGIDIDDAAINAERERLRPRQLRKRFELPRGQTVRGLDGAQTQRIGGSGHVFGFDLRRKVLVVKRRDEFADRGDAGLQEARLALLRQAQHGDAVMREHTGNRVRHRRAGIAVKRFPQVIELFCGRVGRVSFRLRRLRLLRVFASGAGRLRRNRGLRGFRLNIGNSSSAICFISGICCGGFRPGISSSDLNGHGSNIVGNDLPGYVIGIHCCRFLLVVRQDVGDNDFASIIAEIGFGRLRFRFLDCDVLRSIRGLELQRKLLFLFCIFGNKLLRIFADGLICRKLRNCSNAGILGKTDAADAGLELACLAKAQNGNGQLSGLFP